ncbi:hypothetical protein ACFFNY_32580 [Paenibacillus hodogayensis]|uniref:Extracellular solute-binding protein n=1 Tax=Paenibacillus hodogayensis TaxID=279208 RepID=A0ABV5W7R3_9BACL
MRKNGLIAATALLSAAAWMMCGCEREAGGTDGTDAIKSDMPVLRVATLDNYFSSKSYADNLPVWREIEKRTGVKIAWEVVPRDQFGDVMRLRLSKGTDLPDIFHIPEIDPVRLAGKGTILPLDELISKHARTLPPFCVNIRKSTK